MPTFEDELRVNAPIDHVFEFVNTPSNWDDLLPLLREIDDVERMSDGGHRFAYTLSLIGRQVDGYVIRLAGRAETVDFEPSERLVSELTGDVQALVELQLRTTNGTTLVTLTAEYDFARSVRETVSDPAAERYFTRGLTGILPNLKTNMEGW